MADAFSSSSETVIQRVVDVTVKTNTPLDKLEELYEIKKTCEFIAERQFQKVKALSFFSFYLKSYKHSVHPYVYKSEY